MTSARVVRDGCAVFEDSKEPCVASDRLDSCKRRRTVSKGWHTARANAVEASADTEIQVGVGSLSSVSAKGER